MTQREVRLGIERTHTAMLRALLIEQAFVKLLTELHRIITIYDRLPLMRQQQLLLAHAYRRALLDANAAHMAHMAPSSQATPKTKTKRRTP